MRTEAGISSSSLAKLGKGENVTADVLCRVCDTLECDVADFMQFVPEKMTSDQETVETKGIYLK